MLGEVTRAHGRAFALGQVLPGLRFALGIEFGQRKIAHHHGEQVVEIVRDAAGEDAERLELRRARQRRIEPGGLFLFQLLTDQVRLLLDPAPQNEHPAQTKHQTDRQEAGEGEHPPHRPPGRASEQV